MAAAWSNRLERQAGEVRARASSASAVGDDSRGSVTGNDVDPKRPAEARKAAASEPEPRDPAAHRQRHRLRDQEETSDHALTAAKIPAEEIAPKISEDDYRKYRLFDLR